MSGELLWFWLLGGLAWIFSAVCMVDVGLYLSEKQTVSGWLRIHPAWFWVPSAIIWMTTVVLGIHLFLFTGG